MIKAIITSHTLQVKTRNHLILQKEPLQIDVRAMIFQKVTMALRITDLNQELRKIKANILVKV